MRALIVSTGRLLSPFHEAPGEALYGTSTLGATQRGLLEKRGLKVDVVAAGGLVPAGPGPVVVIADHCFVSEKALGDFLGIAFDVVAGASGAGKSARLALAKTASVEFTLPLSSASVEPFDDVGPGAKQQARGKRETAAEKRVAYDCFFVGDVDASLTGAALLEKLRAESVRVVVKKGELAIPIQLPTLGDGGNHVMLMPVTSTLAAHIEHWVHVLWLNQAAFGTRWLEIARAERAWVAWRLLTSTPYTFAALSKRFVHAGKNVRIHPTAYVEASILGDNVVIGAKASVRHSVLGDGVVVGDHATVLSSTLSNEVKVTPRTFVVWSAAYPKAVLSNYKLQVSLIGRGASLSTWAGFIDAKLQGSVEVKHDGVLRSTERSFLGSCLGHGAHVGAKVLLLPGREVPNGSFLTMRDDELVREIPAELPAGVPLVRHQGTLVPLSSLLAPRAS
jgi:acetyltransferase-like isoleucine patch superfamily enzyme